MGNSARDMKPDAMHLRLDTLWCSLQRIDFKEAVIHVDHMTWRCIMNSGEAYSDGSIRFDGSGSKWRDLPVVIRAGLVSVLVTDDAPSAMDIIDEPFCMYIEAVKRNSRRIYLDDGQTDKQFL